MKKLFTALIITAICIWGAGLKAHAACTKGTGYVCIKLIDEAGNSVAGDANTKVTIIAEGSDGDWGTLPNPSFDNIVDGSPQDGDGAADGDIEVLLYHSSDPGQRYLVPGGNAYDYYYTVTTTSGYVDITQTNATYDTVTPSNNNRTATMLFTLKITLHDELGQPLTGASVTIAGAGDGTCNSTFTDGVNGPVGDRKVGAADGVLYIKCPEGPAQDDINMTISKSGYLNYDDNTQKISSGGQPAVTTSNQYPFVITATDELGNALALKTFDSRATLGGLTSVAKAYGASPRRFTGRRPAARRISRSA